MRKKIDIETWSRKDHFNFFKSFDEPFFGATVIVDCEKAFKYCKANNESFFLYYLYLSLKAANQVAPFKYRIVEDEVFQYDVVNASPTINRSDDTFGFSYMDYQSTWEEFKVDAKTEIEKVQNSTGLVPAVSGENVIHYSSIPWLNFTSLSHARSFKFKDSCPKISFGKMVDFKMPVSIHVHHALMDGKSVGEFVDIFQALLNEN